MLTSKLKWLAASRSFNLVVDHEECICCFENIFAKTLHRKQLKLFFIMCLFPRLYKGCVSLLLCSEALGNFKPQVKGAIIMNFISYMCYLFCVNLCNLFPLHRTFSSYLNGVEIRVTQSKSFLGAHFSNLLSSVSHWPSRSCFTLN